jgi:hypothetical protein
MREKIENEKKEMKKSNKVRILLIKFRAKNASKNQSNTFLVA